MVFHHIVGCAMDVYNEYGYGLSEYPYQYGLKFLLRWINYRVEKEYELPLYLFGNKLEENYRCDLVLVRQEGNVIIECKAVMYIDDSHREQLQNYMRLTHSPYGILINFCKTKNQLYSEVFKYCESDNKSWITRLDTRYIGDFKDPLVKPWQPYLDKKKDSKEHFFCKIDLR